MTHMKVGAVAIMLLATAVSLRGNGVQPSQTIVDGDAKLVSFEDLVYPPVARSMGIQGVVVVRVSLGDEGQVVDAAAISGAKLLIADAVANVKRWRFRPGPLKEAIVVYDFRIEPGACHDRNRSLFCLRHQNLATITSCESVVGG